MEECLTARVSSSKNGGIQPGEDGLGKTIDVATGSEDMEGSITELIRDVQVDVILKNSFRIGCDAGSRDEDPGVNVAQRGTDPAKARLVGVFL